MNDGEFIQDDFLFKPYSLGGYQCIIPTERGDLSIRTGKETLFTTEEGPYEVRYPCDKDVQGSQTAEDIWEYLKTKKQEN